MQTPWNQNGLTLKTWITQELQSMVQSASNQNRVLRASLIVHHLFLSTVTRYPELWSMRRDYYTHAAWAVIDLWKRLRNEEKADHIVFACQADEAVALIDRLDRTFRGQTMALHLARLKCLLGLGEVEIAEILDIPERSVRRQIKALNEELLQSL